jgi:opacity protein-like surface antigen
MLLLGLTLTLLGTNALAQEDDGDGAADYARTGMYLAVSGVYVVENWAGSNDDAGAEDSQGFNLRVGARISEWASIELELEWIDDFFPDERQDFQLVTVVANTRVYPLGGRIQPFALAGLGIVATVVDHRDRDSSVKQSNADWGFRAGAGVDLYLTDQIAVSIEATQTWTVGDVKNIHHVSIGIGILYRF